MKICWDMLEGLYLTKQSNLKKGTVIYIERLACKKCGEVYLTKKCRPSNFCSRTCVLQSEEMKQKISKTLKELYRNSGNHPMFGKLHSEKTKQQMKENHIDVSGKSNPNWQDDVTNLGIPLYDTYAVQISYVEEVRRDPKTPDWFQVKCAYCGKWYMPTRNSVNNRIGVLEGRNHGEARFYCSENCKLACPIYHQKKWPKDFKHATSREVDPQLRQMVLERDNWTCQICGKTVDEVELHCHHMDPAAQNPMFQNDMDGCITLCKECHGWVHTQYGCRYIDLRCDRGEKT